VEREPLDLLRTSSFVAVIAVSAVTGEGMGALRERLGKAGAAERRDQEKSGVLLNWLRVSIEISVTTY
jgi:selenocysteine-specific translation elongation factor